jgi:hypothetical protein
MRVEPNAKFGAFFLSQCAVRADLPQEEELQPGMWATRRLGFEMAEHWQAWLGSLAADEMKQNGFGMYVTASSSTPDVIDRENAALEQRANDLLNALLLQGVPRIERGFVAHGVNRNGTLEIRGYSPMDHHYRTSGLFFSVGLAEARRAQTLAERLRHVENSQPDWTRLMRGIRTLLLANRETNTVGDRLHQFVRAVEAMIKPRAGSSRNDFAHRGQTLTLNNAETREILLQLYDARSLVEHLNKPTDALPPGGTAEQERGLMDRRTRQIDLLARDVFIRILESPELLETLRTDDQIDAFWRMEHGERIRLWGHRLDVARIE